jgi:hypothetical protein
MTATQAPTAGHHCYHPEMGEAKPAAQIEASLGHYGKHWYLNTPLVLGGRGVVLLERMTEANLVPGSRMVGWYRYKVTLAAFDRLAKQYAVVSEMLL